MLPRPVFRYYIRKKGVVEGGTNSCAGCHTRTMPDGSFLEGGQGSAGSFRSAVVLRVRKTTPEQFRRQLDSLWASYGAPWVMDRGEFEELYTKEEFLRYLTAQHSGVLPRQGTSFLHPVHIPSLIGVQDRKYLDATGLVRNRSIGDLMRYAILNQGLDTLAYFGDFQPGATPLSSEEGTRYSDEQL
jgi:hypothetical protein